MTNISHYSQDSPRSPAEESDEETKGIAIESKLSRQYLFASIDVEWIVVVQSAKLERQVRLGTKLRHFNSLISIVSIGFLAVLLDKIAWNHSFSLLPLRFCFIRNDSGRKRERGDFPWSLSLSLSMLIRSVDLSSVPRETHPINGSIFSPECRWIGEGVRHGVFLRSPTNKDESWAPSILCRDSEQFNGGRDLSSLITEFRISFSSHLALKWITFVRCSTLFDWSSRTWPTFVFEQQNSRTSPRRVNLVSGSPKSSIGFVVSIGIRNWIDPFIVNHFSEERVTIDSGWGWKRTRATPVECGTNVGRPKTRGWGEKCWKEVENVLRRKFSRGTPLIWSCNVVCQSIEKRRESRLFTRCFPPSIKQNRIELNSSNPSKLNERTNELFTSVFVSFDRNETKAKHLSFSPEDRFRWNCHCCRSRVTMTNASFNATISQVRQGMSDDSSLPLNDFQWFAVNRRQVHRLLLKTHFGQDEFLRHRFDAFRFVLILICVHWTRSASRPWPSSVAILSRRSSCQRRFLPTNHDELEDISRWRDESFRINADLSVNFSLKAKFRFFCPCHLRQIPSTSPRCITRRGFSPSKIHLIVKREESAEQTFLCRWWWWTRRNCWGVLWPWTRSVDRLVDVSRSAQNTMEGRNIAGGWQSTGARLVDHRELDRCNGDDRRSIWRKMRTLLLIVEEGEQSIERENRNRMIDMEEKHSRDQWNSLCSSLASSSSLVWSRWTNGDKTRRWMFSMKFVCHRKEQIDVFLQIDDRTTMTNLLLLEVDPSCHLPSVFILLWSIVRLAELIRSMLLRRSLGPDQMSTIEFESIGTATRLVFDWTLNGDLNRSFLPFVTLPSIIDPTSCHRTWGWGCETKNIRDNGNRTVDQRTVQRGIHVQWWFDGSGEGGGGFSEQVVQPLYRSTISSHLIQLDAVKTLIKCFIVHINVDRQEFFVQINQALMEEIHPSTSRWIWWSSSPLWRCIVSYLDRSRAGRRNEVDGDLIDDGSRTPCSKPQRPIWRRFDSSSNPMNWKRSIHLMTFDDNRKTIRMNRWSSNGSLRDGKKGRTITTTVFKHF